MKGILNGLLKGAMKGRTLYVIPFCMGPIGSEHAKIGIQLTDSPYVVCNMKIMARMGSKIMKIVEENPTHDFIPCLHSVGHPLSPGQKVKQLTNHPRKPTDQ